ncbi:MAG TPA: YpmA family protein [Peptococcaceae bacterium]|nr:YpmA family protein [Peptococcaceae bacterium]
MDKKINENVSDNLKPGKMELIATQRFAINPEMYRIIDFLNRSLKGHNILFGLTKSENSMIISVYEVE